MVCEILTVQDACLNYGAFRALDQVSFVLRQGECLAIIGANGAGKTSLFDALSGYSSLSSGQIHLLNKRVDQLPMQDRFHAGLIRCDQQTRLFLKMSVLENLQCAAFWHNTPARGRYAFWRLFSDMPSSQRLLMEVFDQIEMDVSPSTRAEDLSHADQKKLMLGMALASQAFVWLLDEPVAGLDVAQTQWVVSFIRKHKAGRAFLLVEHDLPVIFELADRILVMEQGRMLACDTPEHICRNAYIQETYLRGFGADGVEATGGVTGGNHVEA